MVELLCGAAGEHTVGETIKESKELKVTIKYKKWKWEALIQHKETA